MKVFIIKSVSGINLQSGLNRIRIKKTVMPKKVCFTPKKETDKKWFTNWNDELLSKIKDYKRING